MSRRVAVVTGASGGIGAALAEVFAENGHDVVLVARSADRLASQAQTLADAHGVLCDWIAADLAVTEDCDQLLEELARRDYSVDVLVNNAGALYEGAFLDTSLERQEGLVALNVLAVLRLTHGIARGMRARNAGRILNVASTSAFNPVPSLACYGASKAFLLSFSEALAMELGDTHVTVTALCPGFTNTGMIAQDGRSPMKLPIIPNLEPRAVAEHGYAACMRGEPVSVPGVLNNLSAAGLRRLPDWLRRRVIAAVAHRGV